jgi:hypothetical protein
MDTGPGHPLKSVVQRPEHRERCKARRKSERDIDDCGKEEPEAQQKPRIRAVADHAAEKL